MGEGAGDQPPEEPFDVSVFDEAKSLFALRVPVRLVQQLQKSSEIRGMLFKRRGMGHIMPVEGDKSVRLLLFQPEVTSVAQLPAAAQSHVEKGDVQFMQHEVRLGYQHVTMDEALRRLLPPGVEVPRGFETVGHLAHFNLRDTQYPHRHTIGRVVLDKNPSIKTVVTKIGMLSNEFRTFDMEVIAGRDDTNVVVSEHGIKLRFDFRQVYWNSRLNEERTRLLEQVSEDDVVCDIFAGVGAFALLCAAKGCCSVWANDLNPESAAALRQNAALNRLDVQTFNLCARACVAGPLRTAHALRPRHTEAGPEAPRVHVVMNLPELALDFLDAFRGMMQSGVSELFSGSAVELRVHCHCFAHDDKSPDTEIHPRIVKAMGALPAGLKIREVRDVAPKKNMYCVEFALPLRAACGEQGESLGPTLQEPEAGEDGSTATKRPRVE